MKYMYNCCMQVLLTDHNIRLKSLHHLLLQLQLVFWWAKLFHLKTNGAHVLTESLVPWNHKEQQRSASHCRGSLWLFLCWLVHCDSCYRRHYARRTVDQSDGIYNTCSPIAWDLWQRKLHLSSGYALGFRSAYCRNSRAITITYYWLWICQLTCFLLFRWGYRPRKWRGYGNWTGRRRNSFYACGRNGGNTRLILTPVLCLLTRAWTIMTPTQ